jgi:hypothetical protein
MIQKPSLVDLLENFFTQFFYEQEDLRNTPDRKG